MKEFIDVFVTIILPTVAVIGMLSRIAVSRRTELLLFELIGVMADKGQLTVEDLRKMNFFQPRRTDILNTLREMI